MRVRTCLVLLLCLLACGGCGKKKSTDELIDGSEVGPGERAGSSRFASCRSERGTRPRSCRR